MYTYIHTYAQVDCLGRADTVVRTTPDFSNWGQMAFIETETNNDRLVCDRCLACGGFNDCPLFCDSTVDSGKQMDLCGVCGGFCVAPDCEIESCAPLYMRYLGSKFPLDADVSIDGLTAGKYLKDGLCTQPVPQGSAFGRCKVRIMCAYVCENMSCVCM